jgi:O-antigen ligase/polysaccharide polymerase Wzy-like membrane protein
LAAGQERSPELTELLLLVGVVGGVAVVAITARYPVFGAAALAIGVPLTTALGRDTVIPVLRPNEAILLLVLAGLGLRHLWRRPSVSYIGLDLAIVFFAVGTSLIPWLVLWFGRVPMDFDTWRAVLGPLQFLAVYVCFAEVRGTDRNLRWLLNLALLATVIEGVVAVLELLDFPAGARGLFGAYFPADQPPLPPGSGYRPTGLLANYGAVGAFAMLGALLALALSRSKDSRLNNAWLTTAMAVNLAALVASLTWAPALALVVGIGVLVWYMRRVPWQVWFGVITVVVVVVVLWPVVSDRIEGSNVDVGTIQNIDARFKNWQLYFVPVLAEHIWLGTGTVIPGDLPPYLSDFVDSEFLRIGFRAGLVGIGLLLLMFSWVSVVSLKYRHSVDPWLQRLGAVSLATIVMVLFVGLTAEYLSFGGVSQYIALLFGLLAARTRSGAPGSIPVESPILRGVPSRALTWPSRRAP